VTGKLIKPSLTNTLAGYENLKIADKKSFITLGPGDIVRKLFTSDIYVFS